MRIRAARLAGFLAVAAAHLAVLWGLWQQRMIPDARSAVTLFVHFVGLPAPEPAAQPRQPPRPAPRPASPLLAAEAAAAAPAESVAPPPDRRPVAPEPEPRSPAPAPATPVPAAPMVLAAELSATCAERPAPAYPPTSRRLNEAGTVVVRVELDEAGRVAAARVAASSGHPRLDEAGLAAVRTWHCTPARRDGQAVRAVALQPFRFVLPED